MFLENFCRFDGKRTIEKYFFCGEFSFRDEDVVEVEELLCPFYGKRWDEQLPSFFESFVGIFGEQFFFPGSVFV